MSRFGRLLRDLLLVAVIIAGFRYFQTRELPSGPAPSLVGTGLSGETVSLERFRGEPVIVYFWASWCGVCRAMEGNVEGLADVKVVRVAVASGKADAVARARRGARRDRGDRRGRNARVVLGRRRVPDALLARRRGPDPVPRGRLHLELRALVAARAHVLDLRCRGSGAARARARPGARPRSSPGAWRGRRCGLRA